VGRVRLRLLLDGISSCWRIVWIADTKKLSSGRNCPDVSEQTFPRLQLSERNRRQHCLGWTCIFALGRRIVCCHGPAWDHLEVLPTKLIFLHIYHFKRKLKGIFLLLQECLFICFSILVTTLEGMHLRILAFVLTACIGCVYVFCDATKPHYCEMARELHKSVNATRLFPLKLTANLNKAYIECEKQKKSNQAATAAGFGLLAILFAGPLGAALAGPGLFGAAAVSHGLAVLGGGSLAAGGFGVAGGTTLLSTAGCMLGTSLAGLGTCTPSPLGQHEDFYIFESGAIAFQGTIRVTESSILFEQGKLFDMLGPLLFDGQFVDNVPVTCG
jgi:hypothetical protein